MSKSTKSTLTIDWNWNVPVSQALPNMHKLLNLCARGLDSKKNLPKINFDASVTSKLGKNHFITYCYIDEFLLGCEMIYSEEGKCLTLTVYESSHDLRFHVIKVLLINLYTYEFSVVHPFLMPSIGELIEEQNLTEA